MANTENFKPEQTATVPFGRNNNAWLICLGAEVTRYFSVTVDRGSSLFRGVEEGDGMLIAGGDPLAPISFAVFTAFVPSSTKRHSSSMVFFP